MQSTKESESGIRGEEDCTRDKFVRECRLERMRARAGREVSGVWRRVSSRRDWLLGRVAKAERPLDDMPRMLERVRLFNEGNAARLASVKALLGRSCR